LTVEKAVLLWDA